MSSPTPDTPDRPAADSAAGAPLLKQAPILPLDEDGLTVAIVGTALWLVTMVVLLVIGDLFAAEARWVRVCIAGAALGLVGIGYILIRRRRSRSGADRDDAPR